jgi:RNA polymerase sigma-70 factor, ECF subfamily
MGVVQDAVVRAKTTPAHELERLYREHGERLWRAVFAYAGDAAVADDAVAEALAQALRRGSELRDPLRWLWRTAFRIAAGELKARRARVGDAATGRPHPAAGDAFGVADEVRDLMVALTKVSSSQRQALILHHYAEFSVKEIAGVMGSTSAAVKMHLSRGRRRLRSLLEDDDA